MSWTLAAAGFWLALFPAAIGCARGELTTRMASLVAAAGSAALGLAALAVAQDRAELLDAATLGALLGSGGGLTFARFLERWMQ
jgi:multisubunit Na+/H+ antiporter MnhF subunit